MRILTHRQRQIFLFIVGYLQDQGWPPTVREIAKEFGIGSPNGVVWHLKALQRSGFIEKAPGARAIRLPGFRVRVEPIVISQS